MLTPVPFTRDLVLVGGGHAHALVLRKWGMNPMPGVRVTLINPGPAAPYTGMLPGYIAGHYTQDALEIDLVKLCRFAGARFINAPATHIDPAAKTITVQGTQMAYDTASIDVGITAQMSAIDGFDDFAIGAKPLGTFAARWSGFLDAVAQGAVPADVAVIGGGVAGAELAMAVAFALRERGQTARLSIIERAGTLTGVGRRMRQNMLAHMADMGITLHTNAAATQIGARHVTLACGTKIPAALCVGAAGAIPHKWLGKTQLSLQNGFIVVDENLCATGQDSLFAVGDCAHLSHAPRPKAGVFAVRAAPVLLHNLKAALGGGTMRPFRPQRTYLKLVSLGGKSACAEKAGISISGAHLWRLKDRIDQKFISKFQNYPAMPTPKIAHHVALDVRDLLEGGKPLCGGCGSKLGAGVLGDTLENLPHLPRPDVISKPGDDAAILVSGAPEKPVYQVLSTDHLRGFSHDPRMMAKIAAVHALGDIWSMGAAPQAALASIVMPHMSPTLQARTLRDIMEAATNVFHAAGADIVGGHSSMGAELTIGFSVTGTSMQAPISHTGARAGDAIILTRPIGTGTILAGEMAGAARGRDVMAMLEAMSEPQTAAAEILGTANAMTDVTGFGLSGHLMSLCKASNVGAQIDLSKIPFYSGAQDLAQIGTRSTIYQSNRDNAAVQGGAGPARVLLDDPQTAGGLLAAVPIERAQDILVQLKQAGCRAAQIGVFTTGSPVIKCVSL